MMDTTTPIIEEESVTTNKEPMLERKTQSLLCSLGFHRRTMWSKPFSRKQVGVSLLFFGGGSSTTEQEYWFQIRECLGCGMREERSV